MSNPFYPCVCRVVSNDNESLNVPPSVVKCKMMLTIFDLKNFLRLGQCGGHC